MEQALPDLYDRYLKAVVFFNSQVDRKYDVESSRAVFRIEPLSQEDFPLWWENISHDSELKSRWLERFEDPAAAFARSCQRITMKLTQIPIQQVAA